MIVVTRPMPRPINTEKRAPITVWTNTSSPKFVVPNQCEADGDCRRSVVKVWGSCGMMIGPKAASSTKKPTAIRPRLALRFPAKIRQIPSQRCVVGEEVVVEVFTGAGVSTCTSITVNFLPNAHGDQAEYTGSQPESSRPAQQG